MAESYEPIAPSPIRPPTGPAAKARASTQSPPDVREGIPALAGVSRGRPISLTILRGCLKAVEFSFIFFIGLLIAIIYVEPQPSVWQLQANAMPQNQAIWYILQYPAASASAGVLNLFIFEILQLYRRPVLSASLRAMPRIFLGWTSTLVVMITLVFFLKLGPEYSRVWLVTWYCTAGVSLITIRLVLSGLIRKWARQGRLNHRAVIFGAGPLCQNFIAALNNDPENDVRILGLFDDRQIVRADPGTDASQPGALPLSIGNLDALVNFVRANHIELVILALPMRAEDRLAAAMRKIGTLPVDVRLAATASKLHFRPRAYSYLGNVPVLDLADRPLTDWNLVAKWTFDKVFALLALVLLSPLMLVTALAIRLESKGPVLFRQKRYGFNNELIEVLKFRSMYVDKCDVSAKQLVSKDDPRVTRVGRIIRKASIDELPQLINVLRGDLSLVGPRPHALHAKAADTLYNDAVENYFARHRVKPGITGWAQINGWRGETDTAEKIRKRVEYDLYYIENWSFLLDLYILVRTPFALTNTDNAY